MENNNVINGIAVHDNIANAMEEDKDLFVKTIGDALCKYSREPVRYMTYCKKGEQEIVTIAFETGSIKNVNVSMDSCIAVMNDIYKALS